MLGPARARGGGGCEAIANCQHMAKVGNIWTVHPPSIILLFPHQVHTNQNQKQKENSSPKLPPSLNSKKGRGILPNTLNNNLQENTGDQGSFNEEWLLKSRQAPRSMQISFKQDQVREGERRLSGGIFFSYTFFFLNFRVPCWDHSLTVSKIKSFFFPSRHACKHFPSI